MDKITYGVMSDKPDGEPYTLEEFIKIRGLESLAITPEIEEMMSTPEGMEKLLRTIGMSEAQKE
jgi:hypothetical protein